MNVIRFNDLELIDKAFLINEFGSLIESTEWNEYIVFLFSIHHYLIEAYYNIELRVVNRISVAEYDDLDKYLGQIKLIFK